MPWLLLLGLGAAGLGGAFVGAQIDDAVEAPVTHPYDEAAQVPSASKIVYYAAIGMGLFWLANKSGTLKALNIK